MFWPFNKWTSAPPPWNPGPGGYNIPVELQQSSFMAARTGMTPTYAARFAAFLSTPATRYMVAPVRVVGAFSKHPGSAFQVMDDAHADLRSLADSALARHVQGLPLSYDEGRALIAIHMPPVVQPQPRCGIGETMSGWDVPYCDRSTAPEEIRDRYRQLEAPAISARRLAVGREIAMLEGIRAAWMSRTPYGGR